MSKEPKQLKAYRALLNFYPRNHLREYGEQMVQTFDDLLSEDTSKQHAFDIWFRVGRELPLNIIEEHIDNFKGANMKNAISSKRVLALGGVLTLAVIGIGIALTVRHNDEFSPTTLSNVQNSGKKPVCLQSRPGEASSPAISEDEVNITNAVTTSIIDVPAGTNVDAYLKTNTGELSTGTAIYSGSYGSYNFTAKQVAKDSGNFSGGWKITEFEACE